MGNLQTRITPYAALSTKASIVEMTLPTPAGQTLLNASEQPTSPSTKFRVDKPSVLR